MMTPMENLLRAYHALSPAAEAKEEEEQPRLRAIATGLCDGATAEEKDVATTLLREHPELQGAWQEIDAALAPPVVKPNRFAKLMLVAAAVCAIVLPTALWRYDANQSAGLTSKGDFFGFSVAVQRGTQRYVLQPGAELIDGDLLGLFYSSANPGYLLVMGSDTNGEATVLFPAGGDESAPVQAGDHQPLADGVRVTPGTGCEWLVAIFSTQALEATEVIRALQRAPRHLETCDLDLSMGGQTVKVFPVRRVPKSQ